MIFEPLPIGYQDRWWAEPTLRILSNGPDGVYDRIEYTYNRQGQRLSMKDQNGSIHQYEYNALGRPLHDRITTLALDVDGAVRRISTTYDVRGNVERATSYDNATVGSGNVVNEVLREYNDYGLLSREYQEHDGAKDGNTPYVGYEYDETSLNGEIVNGLRPTSLRYPNGRLVHYTYGSADSSADILNRLDAINDDNTGSPGDVLASYTYLGLGTVVVQDYEQPDVKLDLFGTTSGVYAGLDRFDRIVDHRWHDYGSSEDIDRFKYGYDRASNRIWKENTVSKSQTTPVFLDEFYTYDGLQRLQNFDRGELNGTNTGITGTPAKKEDWSLDPLGNWSNFVQKSGGATDLDQDREVNRVNEITDISESTGPSWITPSYDRNGNMVVVPKPADPTIGFTCTYDPWNRMVKVEEGLSTIAQYAYDPLKRRISKDVDSTVRHFLYSTKWQSLEERLDSSTDAERQHIWGPQYVDQFILRDRDTMNNGTLDERLFGLQNEHWDISCVVDPNGASQERYSYGAYGSPSVFDAEFSSLDVSAYDWDINYSGYRLDVVTGFHYVRKRLFHSRIGRWLSRDPKQYGSKDMNLYGYGLASPINFTDPKGESVVIPIAVVLVGCACAYDIYRKKKEFRPRPLTPTEKQCLKAAKQEILKARGLWNSTFCEADPPVAIRTTNGPPKTVHYLCGGCEIFLNASAEEKDLDCSSCKGFIKTIATVMHECRHCDQPWGTYFIEPQYRDIDDEIEPDIEIDAYSREIEFLRVLRLRCGAGIGTCSKEECEQAIDDNIEAAEGIIDTYETIRRS